MSLMHVQGTPIKKMVKYAAGRGFTDIAVFNEDKKHVNGLLLIHLPAGPTAHFKLSSLKLSKDIKVSSCNGMSTIYCCVCCSQQTQSFLQIEEQMCVSAQASVNGACMRRRWLAQ